jgi:hypothetical protein
MAPALPYTVFALGDAQLHQLHTSLGKVRSGLCELCEGACVWRLPNPMNLPQLEHQGRHNVGSISAGQQELQPPSLCCLLSTVVPVQLFVMGEVAVELFQETPTAFLQVRSAAGQPESAAVSDWISA